MSTKRSYYNDDGTPERFNILVIAPNNDRHLFNNIESWELTDGFLVLNFPDSSSKGLNAKFIRSFLSEKVRKCSGKQS